jgi:hypothetical protein
MEVAAMKESVDRPLEGRAGAIIGTYGGLVWKYFPESREAVRDLVATELDAAIDQDRQPDAVSVFDYTVHAVFPIVVDRLGEFPLEPDQLERFCQFCRAVLHYSGGDRVVVDNEFDVTLLEAIDFPEAAAAVWEVDPELVDIVRARYGKWKD